MNLNAKLMGRSKLILPELWLDFFICAEIDRVWLFLHISW